MNQLVSVKDASHYLGVSASTFKRVCEKHSIPLMRTAGGHRRIDRADLDRAYGILWKGAKRRHGATESSALDRSDYLMESLIDGDIDKAMAAICPKIDRLDELPSILESTLIAALWKVGELWRNGEIDVYQEHISSNTACTVLDLIMQKLPNPSSESCMAIGGTFERNFDTIGSKIVSLVLRSIGLRTFDLGCNVPVASLVKAACDLDATMVWICHTHVADLDSVLANHQLLRQTLPSSVRIVTGGGALSPAIRRSLCDCLYYESIAVMSESIKHQLGNVA